MTRYRIVRSRPESGPLIPYRDTWEPPAREITCSACGQTLRLVDAVPVLGEPAYRHPLGKPCEGRKS